MRLSVFTGLNALMGDDFVECLNATRIDLLGLFE